MSRVVRKLRKRAQNGRRRTDTLPVAPETVLMRTPFAEFVIVDSEIVTVFTVLSSRPPTEPMLSPWPPEQVPPVKTIFWKR